MAGNSTLQVQLNLDVSGFSGGITTATSGLQRLSASVNAVSSQVNSAQGSIHSFTSSLAEFTIAGLGMEKAMEGLKAVFFDFPKMIVDANAEMQKMQTMFVGLSSAASDVARHTEATDWMAKVYDMAQKTPFSVNTLTDSFVKMKAVGMDPLDGSLQALSDAVASFGGSNEQFQHASLAIMEMAGRGTVSLEQLRRQLGKAIPEAIHDMAFALDMTYGQLMAAVQKGTLESTTALEKMFEEMKIVYAGQGLAHMQNFIGQTAIFRTQWALLAQDVGKAGFMDAVQAQFQKVIDLMKSPVVREMGQTYGKTLADMINGTAGFVEKLIDFRNEITRIGEVMLAVFAAAATRSAIAGLTGLFTTLAGTIRNTLASAMQTYYSAASQALNVTQFWNTGGIAAAQAVGVFSAAMRGLGLAFINIIPVAGQLILILYTIAEAMGLFTNKANDAAKNIEDGFITQKAVDTVKGRVAELKKELVDAQKPVENYDALGNKTGVIDTVATDDEIKRVQTELDRFGSALEKGTQEMNRRAVDALTAAGDKGIQAASADLVQQYKEGRHQLEQAAEAPGADTKAIKAQRLAIEKTYYDGLIGVQEKYLAEAKTMEASEDQVTQLAGKKREADALDNIHNLTTQRDQALRIGEEMVKTVAKQSKGLNPVQQELLHLAEITATATAKMSDLGTEHARVATMIAAGKFKDATAGDKAAMLAAADAADKATKAESEYAKAKQKNATAISEINTKYQESADKLRQIQAQLNAGSLNPETAGLRTFSAELEHLKSELTVTGPQLVAINKQIEDAVANMKQITLDQKLLELRDKTIQINASLADTTNQQREASFQAEKNRLEQLVVETTKTAEQRKAAEDQLQGYISARRAQVDRENENALQKMAREWQDTSKLLSDATASWINDGLSQIDNFVKTGKFDFASLADSIISDIIKIQIEAMASPLLKAAGGAFGSFMNALGIGAGAGTAGIQAQAAGDMGMSIFHTGGIVGLEGGLRSVSTALFANAGRFHDGGMPGLAPNEVPAILQRGEGVFTAQQMKAMGGSGGDGFNIQVNVINQSGQQMDATTGKPRFDGEQMVLDIVLKAASRPGSFRDNMKGALSS